MEIALVVVADTRLLAPWDVNHEQPCKLSY